MYVTITCARKMPSQQIHAKKLLRIAAIIGAIPIPTHWFC